MTEDPPSPPRTSARAEPPTGEERYPSTSHNVQLCSRLILDPPPPHYTDETKKRAKEIRELKAANHRSQLDKHRTKMMQSGASSDEVKRIQLTRAKRIEKRRTKMKAKQKDKLVDVKRMKELKKQK